MEELYGSGVHAFFSGNYPQAISDLTSAADGGSKDPRVMYFRAMAKLRIGDNQGAEADMEQGSALECADINQYYPVSKSLERVQGSGRLMLERHRTKARAEAHMREERRNAARYEMQRRAEADVLRAAPAPGAVAPAPAATKPGPAAPGSGRGQSVRRTGCSAAGRQSGATADRNGRRSVRRQCHNSARRRRNGRRRKGRRGR